MAFTEITVELSHFGHQFRDPRWHITGKRSTIPASWNTASSVTKRIGVEKNRARAANTR